MSATTGLVDEPMVQFQLYSPGAKAVPCAAVTACHDKVKVWYFCYMVVSLPMECWLKKASLNTAGIESGNRAASPSFSVQCIVQNAAGPGS